MRGGQIFFSSRVLTLSRYLHVTTITHLHAPCILPLLRYLKLHAEAESLIPSSTYK